MSTEDLDRFAGAYSADFKFHDENLSMLSWYAARMVPTLRRAAVRSMVSLGIGHRVVSRTVIEGLADSLARYTIVEGSAQSISDFCAGGPLPACVDLIHARFEEFDPGGPVDAIEMGFVLEHVDDPDLVLRRYAGFLRPGGVMVVVVPNARSLHRLFGQAAGLLDDVYRLSEHDLALGHKRYYDLESLTRAVSAAGMRVVRTEGVFLKPLSTGQLERLQLPSEVRRSFFEVGVAHPALCNAIYLETTV
jgi:SAM-dependent methyltransferase